MGSYNEPVYSGEYNTANGVEALYGNTTGNYNTASGAFALKGHFSYPDSILQRGSYNTASGVNALAGNSTGSYNTANGVFALEGSNDNTPADSYPDNAGDHNTATGAFALRFNRNGNNNSAFGVYALQGYVSDEPDGYHYYRQLGNDNTAAGANALRFNDTGSQNTASGYQALQGGAAGISGSWNTANGNQALFSNTTGASNTGTGTTALYRNTTGQQNTANGGSALYSNTSGNQNSAFGTRSLYSATVGVRNVAVGYQAGQAITTGSDNIILGASNQGVAAENGVIRIGNKTYQKKAFIAGIRGVTTGSATASTVFVDVNGQLGTIKSSRRYKEDIQSMGSVSEKLFGLRPVTFRYMQPFDDGSKPVQYGLIAEEVAEVMPELVVYGEDGKPETVSYHLLATLLLNEVQKEHRVVEALRRDNDAQAARMAALEQQVAVLAKSIERADKNRMVASTK